MIILKYFGDAQRNFGGARSKSLHE